MNRFLTFVFVFLFAFSIRSAFSCDFQIIKEFEIGQQPVRIFYDPVEDLYHAFCNGNDIDYDGIFDNDLSEEKPSWWTFSIDDDMTVDINRVMYFESGFFPHTAFYPAIDIAERRIYIPFSPKYDVNFNIIEQGKVSVYDIDDQSEIQNEIISLDPSSVAILKNIIFITGQNEDMVNMVYAIDKSTFELVDEMPAGASVQQIVAIDDPNGWIIGILNEGGFGENNSTLMTTRFLDNQFGEVTETDLGDTGHFLMPYGSGFASVMNGSHEVLLIEDNSINSVLEFESTGYDGPREIIILFRIYMISSYDGSISFYERFGDSYYFIQKIELAGKADAMLYANDLLFVCSPLDASYQKLSKVYMLQDQHLSINTDKDNPISIYPNPARSVLNINANLQDFSGTLQISIVNPQGNIILQEAIHAAENVLHQIDLTNVAQGAYYLKLYYGNEVKVMNFNLIR